MHTIEKSGARWICLFALLASSAACSSSSSSNSGSKTTQAQSPAGAKPPTSQCKAGETAECTGTTCKDGVHPKATCSSAGSYSGAECLCPKETGTSTTTTTSKDGGRAGSAGKASGTGGKTSGSGGQAGGSGGQPASGNIWAMMGYDVKNNYFNPGEKTLTVANASKLKEKWRFTIAGYPPGSPVVAEGKVFVMATGGTYAINLADGTMAWARMDITGTASMAYADGFVYAHTSAGAGLYKLKVEDGTTVWGPIRTYDVMSCDGTSSPIVNAGKVMVGHSCGVPEVTANADQAIARGGVEAFNTDDGSRAWTYFTAAETGENGAMVWSTVSVDAEAGVVFAATGNNYTMLGAGSDSIHAIDLGTGKRKWVGQVRKDDMWTLFTGGSQDTDFGANPILAEVGGKKIVANGDKGSAFWALDRETGQILWSRTDLSSSHGPANGGVLMNGAFDGKRFYVVSNQPPSQSVLHALDPEKDGADAWPAKTFDKITWGAPSLANGLLVVPIDDDLYILNAETGDQLAMFNTGGSIAAGAAAIADGKIVVQSGLQYSLGTAKNNNQVICYGL